MPTDDIDLDALMARLADGDRAAFPTAFRVLWPTTLRLCRSLVKNDADAEDAAQQAMEKILARAAEYDRLRPAMPWALAIAAWECRTVMRKRERRREVPEDHAPDSFASAATEDQVVETNLAQAALVALGQLSAADRETLQATFWNEASTGADATFRKRRQRALSRLRDTFRRLYGIG